MHTPAYLLRRHAVLRLLRRLGRQRFLEIGCGRGDLLALLGARGWEGLGLEIGERAAAVASAAVAPFADRVRVVRHPSDVVGQYPLVMALEVLEHIEDDAGTLRQWREWVAPSGRLVLSVPAHQHFWTLSDELGGHVRRYERAGLQQLVQEAGFTIGTFWSFGFPLTSVTTRFRSLVSQRRLAKVAGLTAEERTLESSFDSTRQDGGGVLGSVVELAGYAAHWAQVPFLRTDLGASYLVECVRTD